MKKGYDSIWVNVKDVLVRYPLPQTPIFLEKFRFRKNLTIAIIMVYCSYYAIIKKCKTQSISWAVKRHALHPGTVGHERPRLWQPVKHPTHIPDGALPMDGRRVGQETAEAAASGLRSAPRVVRTAHSETAASSAAVSRPWRNRRAAGNRCVIWRVWVGRVCVCARVTFLITILSVRLRLLGCQDLVTSSILSLLERSNTWTFLSEIYE